MSSSVDVARKSLEEVALQLEPIFSRLGYTWELSIEGSSSGGPFATGYFDGPAGRIGLIWRLGSGLGSVSYGPHELSAFHCAHNDVVEALGATDRALFSFDRSQWKTLAKGGLSLVQALAHDIEHITSRVLTQPPEVLAEITKNAQERFMRELRGEK